MYVSAASAQREGGSDARTAHRERRRTRSALSWPIEWGSVVMLACVTQRLVSAARLPIASGSEVRDGRRSSRWARLVRAPIASGRALRSREPM